jgi:hypothetical protein
MVKMAIFSAWAELQIASAEQKYLVDVLKPHIAKLTPLWLASLREFARLRFEPDISTTSSGPATLSGNLDSIYAALNRETLLQVLISPNLYVHFLILYSSINPRGSISSTLLLASLTKTANSSSMLSTAKQTPRNLMAPQPSPVISTIAMNQWLSSLCSLGSPLKPSLAARATHKRARRRF